ncbi:hypothetical protein CHGG_06628 [Chaetomium globosum CBS 148.51]|uniref:RRM domain-containing protein n=1 Tax=Chaetomium globosum (strain ATCC 6205 / CBS 148.51 / DSM 1962 / NBRC 6347 / NRRL 1970) TaxID=306901 RepID=Q2H3Y7_CHAGB|nr:uncharacterized protein CHGG_06628 [Chaetomium globosum CBS 148.51]EAQ90009.1 hypothetical protein CHGG_06628 [Chaetomium globosum CBS 148.51]
MGKGLKNRFAAFIETDDNDDSGGGVLLRDFDDDSHTSNGGGVSTPMGSNSTISSGHECATVPRKNPSTTSFNRPATAGRRNTIAPIGTGRYTEYTANTGGGAALNAPVDAPQNSYPQMTQAQAMQFGYTQGLNAAANNMTPAGTTREHRSPANAMGHSWGSTPTYNSAGNAYTPQTTGHGSAQGTALGANFPFPDTNSTPSHMSKKFGQDAMATPQSESIYNQYNQTEPRNFAPRGGSLFMPPPPAFNLGRQGATKKHEELQYPAPDCDPFMSPPSKGTNGHAISQALVLSSVPENNQVASAPGAYQDYYCPVPAEIRAVRSTQLNRLTEGPTGMPTQEVALSPESFPFMETTTQAAPVGHGVVKIRNIPFGTKRAEIIAFLGRNSKILNDNQEPVHIIMERVSSKTQDCYVEFMTTQDAVRAVDRHRDNIQKGRPSRLGERPIELLLSSQAALMMDLFPLASGVWWDNAKPVIQAPIDGQPWKTFKGFVTEEEMTMLVKHVEIPQRSPYSKECPQRPYECMISTIKKLPWYMADRITLRQRYAIYAATVKLITLLQQALHRDHNRNHETVINKQLMKRLVTAAMLCPGFSVVQKDNIATLAEMDQDQARMFNQPRFAEQWVHLHGVCPKPGTPLDMLEWYIAIVREETTRYIHRKHIVERNEIQRASCYTSLYFGYIWYEIGLPAGKELDNLSLHEVARCELAVIERAIRRALPSAGAHEQ